MRARLFPALVDFSAALERVSRERHSAVRQWSFHACTASARVAP